MRLPAFPPGTRVLFVDQWVETGGTMDGAIRLVERQEGCVAGLVALVFEENERTLDFRRKYKCVSAILPDTDWQHQSNRQTLDSFKNYNPERAFPNS